MTFLLPTGIKWNCQIDGRLSGAYCFIDGKVKQTRNSTTLTVIVPPPLLRKQLPLATIKRKSEDSKNVVLFWKSFNEAYNKASSKKQKIEPIAWCTNTAAANTNGLSQIYGSDNLSRIKGREFHFVQSLEKHSKKLDGYNQTVFINLWNDLLKVVSATFLLVCFVCLKEKTCETRKNVKQGKMFFISFWKLFSSLR